MGCTLDRRYMTVLSIGPEGIACLCGADLGEHLCERRQREQPTHNTLIITKQPVSLLSKDAPILSSNKSDLQEFDACHDHQHRVEVSASEAKKW